MKKWRSGLLGSLVIASLSIVCLAVLMAFSGCEGTTEEDSSGVDAYIAAHPYTSASRDTPLSPDLKITISPVQATASIIGQTIVFTAYGGDGAYHWGVSENANGKIESNGADQAMYTCLLVGNNDVIVQDDTGHYAAAHISPVTDAMTISPASASLSGGALNVSLAVAGGTPPYSWTSGNTALGTVSYSASSSYVAAYTAVAGVYGQNVITVIDTEGRTASATITQAL
ncbi:MAG: hypothetical protein KJ964_07150 [Verrucomicrobia bacterium]|nr:hypothetical protein [Verrucomicrobiota bacterium]MBU1735433.1 hypothetical protein [Verrucomicrobiota bacterium]MBU1856828.1 hypothetical protein [Verrucomicrobiota bacterium]